MLLGAIGGPLLKGVATGGILGGLTATQLGAGIAGLTSLAQGNDILTAGLDAFGGYGGAGAIGNLAKVGGNLGLEATKQAAATSGGIGLQAPKAPLTGGAMGFTAAPDAIASEIPSLAGQLPGSSPAFRTPLTVGPTTIPGPVDVPFSFSNVGSGIKDLFSPGGAQRFADITKESALTSVGLPAAGAVMGLGGMGPQQMAAPSQDLGFGPFTPLSELRERNVGMGYAQGGIAALNPMMGVFDARNANRAFGEQMGGYKKGGYLDGPGDGMSDSIPATIEGKQPARLADGEFVMPADVVSHLGNGSTKAGAQRLYSMMDKVRKARTGTTKQGKQIKPEKYMPA
jgi:hypothetical protein